MSTMMLRPTNVVHNFLQSQDKVVVWLMHEKQIRIEGVLNGYDEFMNLVLSDAVEHNTKAGTSVPIGRLLLKGDTVGLIHLAQ